ncbi:MAG: PleD family two-component system response regulator [Pseudomonadota bacterium]
MTARILVVDDVLPNVKLLEAKLSAEYFEVLTAMDGQSALSAAMEEIPDLILLDVMMPGMDGFEVCKRLKSDAKTRHIPVVMVTALSDVADRVRGLEAGADDFLSKPVNDVALFARVRSLIRLKMTMDELRLRQATSGKEDLLEDDALSDEALGESGHILLVECNEFNADKLTAGLTEAGHEVDLACQASDALKIGRGADYDLIIVNLDLDGEDGLRLCSQLRSQEQTRQVPILLILDDIDLPKLAKGLDLGVTDYLVKPIDRNELSARSRTQIRRRRYHDKLRSMLESSVSLAYTDTLTGVYNRRYMNAHLDRKIMDIAETSKPVSVMLFDIDHFKQINDTYGHGAGDEVLKELAIRVTNNVRDFDLVARYGGEEFVVIMPDTGEEAAIRVAERLCKCVAATPIVVPCGTEPIAVTISIGVATTIDPSEEASQLLERADKLLYEAKAGGRNQVRANGLDGPSQMPQAASG